MMNASRLFKTDFRAERCRPGETVCVKTSKHFGESHTAKNSGKGAGMRVFIIESSNPKDFYEQKLDGIAAQGILNILGVKNELRFVLDRKHFEKAIVEAKAMNCNLIHLSCHGGEDCIALADNYQPSWDKFADLFQGIGWCPHALVMSSCCGATSGIRKAFQTKPRRPGIIFGSSDERSYGEYTVAWAILYHRFKIDGVNKDAAQQALKEIHAVVSDKFLYRRWSDSGREYRFYPGKTDRYAITNTRKHKKSS